MKVTGRTVRDKAMELSSISSSLVLELGTIISWLNSDWFIYLINYKFYLNTLTEYQSQNKNMNHLNILALLLVFQRESYLSLALAIWTN